MTRAVILSAVRTPVGRYGGGLSGTRPDDFEEIPAIMAGHPAGDVTHLSDAS